jgi:DNA-binding NtrC family response regulator
MRDIHKVDSEASIVIFTGYPSIETAIESIKNEVFDYIRKPFSPADFKDVIRRIVKKKGLLTNPEEELHRAIGAKIRIQRKKKKLTLKHISNRTGLSVSLLSQIERAESSASLSSLYKIANALDTKLNYLFRDF